MQFSFVKEHLADSNIHIRQGKNSHTLSNGKFNFIYECIRLNTENTEVQIEK